MVRTVTMNAGRPVSAAMDSMNSVVPRGPVPMTNIPLPHLPSSPASAFSSASSAMVEGMGLPPQPLWFGENDEAKPIAPASSASRTIDCTARSSSSLDFARKERVEVHPLHYREIAQHRLAQRRRARRNAEAAVAHHRGRYAERHRGRE